MEIGIHVSKHTFTKQQKEEEDENDFNENLVLEMVPTYKYLHRFM